MLPALVAAIPSPSSGSLHLGPLKLNAYGLMIALGVIVAVRLAGRRAEARGVTDADGFAAIAMWGVPAGVIGGRAYHVITSTESFRGRWVEALYVWQGGLGIWGGILCGVLAGLWKARRMGLDPLAVLSCAGPAIAVAQAIGRWGNWFNQELFGRPTDLPWALSVSDATALKAGSPAGTTFHPTFLYESLGCLLIAWVLVRIERKRAPARGRLFAYYVMLYTAMRFFIEGLRIDPARGAGGLRLNQWVSVAVFAAGGLLLLADRRRSRGAGGASTVDVHE
ncbi:MAG: prolipoprotein diacylglyceryl transferase [Actinomycetota bacterium]